MIVCSKFIFEITIISIPKKINSNSICRKYFCFPTCFPFNATILNARIDKINSFVINVFLLKVNISC